MKYDKLTADHQQQMLDARLMQLEGKHFGHQLLIDQLKASGDKSEQTTAAIKASEDAMKILDSAHVEVSKKVTTPPSK